MTQFKEYLLTDDSFRVRVKKSDDDLIWFDIYQLNLIQVEDPYGQKETKPICKATIDWDAKTGILGELHLEPMNGIIVTKREELDRWSSLINALYHIADELTAQGLES